MTRRPKIAFAYRHALLGGVSTQLLNRARALSDKYELHYLFEEDHGMTILFTDADTRITLTAEQKVEALKDIDPDVFVVIDTPTFLEAWQRAELGGALVIEVHTTYAQNLNYLRQLPTEIDVAALSTVSAYMAERLEALDVGRVAPIAVVPNCLDARWFDPPEPLELDARPLVWVGKLDDHKRWRAGLDLVDRILTDPDVGSDVTPLFVGGYTSNDPEVLRSFLTKLRSTPVLARAEWWPSLSYERMPRLYRSVAAAGGGKVSTTRDESFGMSVAESLLMGCPTVAPRVGALPELLPDVAMYDPNDWTEAEAIGRRMLRDPAYRAEMLSTAGDVRTKVHPDRLLAAFDELMTRVGVNLPASGR